MKNIYKIILFVAMAGVTLFSSSCDNDSDTNAPYISYVRVTNPAAADSLLVAAKQGQQIVIIGGNLQNTQQVWFNDRQAKLTPVYINNKAVIVSVPSEIPIDITNKLKLVFSNGESLLYDFEVIINKPQLNNMNCEYVNEGGTAVINGNYFYLPLSVTFPGGATVSSEDGAVSVDESYKILSVKVPAGAQPGQLTVTSQFGTSKSNFWFRDNRNIFCDYDSYKGGQGDIISDPNPSDPPLISGPYKRVKKAMGEWEWTEVHSWVINHNIPDDAILNPKSYYYKFELCTMKPYNANGVRVWVGDPANNTEKGYYEWLPPVDTKGQWQTITISLEDIIAKNEPFGVLPNYFFGFIYCGKGELDCDMSFVNFRIVLKAIPGND